MWNLDNILCECYKIVGLPQYERQKCTVDFVVAQPCIWLFPPLFENYIIMDTLYLVAKSLNRKWGNNGLIA